MKTRFGRSLFVKSVAIPAWPSIEIVIIGAAIALFAFIETSTQRSLTSILPRESYQFTLSMTFEPTEQVVVRTFLPDNNHRQSILSASSSAPFMSHTQSLDNAGLRSQWSGNENSNTIHYSAIIQSRAYRFSISDQLEVPYLTEGQFSQYLAATDLVQANHPDVIALWESIAPNNRQLQRSLKAIYDYVYQLERLGIKGTTDAVTALKLGAASCNGKSRLFVALARHAGLPSRLISGVILNEGTKKTSHQWLEVLIEDQWVPFDPTNGHFASIPANYLELYRGDEALFSRTADINFDYQFSIKPVPMAPALYAEQESLTTWNIGYWLQNVSLPTPLSAVLLTMPFCALIITVLRNLIGLKSFGIFMPMLVGAYCTLIGLLPGVVGLLFIVAVALLTLIVFEPLRLLKIPKLSLTIVIVNCVVLLLMEIVGLFKRDLMGLLSLFPIIVVSFMADKIHDLLEQNDYRTLGETLAGTAVAIYLCYSAMSSASLVGLLAIYPETYLFIIATLIFVGRWTGLRVSELLRFQKLLAIDSAVVGINHRNRELVEKLNRPKDLMIATDKLSSKTLLQEHAIPVPTTYASFGQLAELEQLDQHLHQLNSFVIKPNAGSQGNGIVVISRREGEQYIGPTGKRYTMKQLRQLVADIICGNYSQSGDADIAYLERIVSQHTLLQSIAPYGLSDIRIVVISGKVVSAMLRIPTTASNGKANLHQGALGAAVDIKTGKILRCLQKGEMITQHPDSGKQIVGETIPYWNSILDISQRCYEAIPLGYMGVDVCLDIEQGPLVLEINGRPGLEIQNVNKKSLLTASKKDPIYT